MQAPFTTDRTESFKTRLRRLGFNLFPAYRRTGARLTFLSDDLQEVHIVLKLKRGTKNYVGTVFGGSMYAAVDPIFMVQLIEVLGNEYIVWDQSATIRFIRPITKVAWARFVIKDELVARIKEEIKEKQEMSLDLPAYFVDEKGRPYAKVSKKMYIADKSFYQKKKAKSR